MKFENKFDVYGDKYAFEEPENGSVTYQAAKKKKSLEEEDFDFDASLDDLADIEGLDSDLELLDKFNDEIDEIDLDDIDLDEFDDDLMDDDLDGMFGSEGKSHKRSRKDDDDVDLDDIDDSKFYNDEFKDFDNYTTISDFDDDLDTYIENEGGGYYDYDDRY